MSQQYKLPLKMADWGKTFLSREQAVPTFTTLIYSQSLTNNYTLYFQDIPIVAVNIGNSSAFVMAITEDGKVYGWGR